MNTHTIDFTLNDAQVKEALSLWIHKTLVEEKKILASDIVVVERWEAVPSAINAKGRVE